MKRFAWLLLWFAILAGLAAASLANAQCPGGQCPGVQGLGSRIDVGLWNLGPRRQPAPQIDVRVRGKAKEKQPTPAWRYERPEKHRAAVVRIFCQDDVRTRSIGSGVLVKWGNKLLVLTARHVVRDAKKIIVEFWNKKTLWATVRTVDATWDCAVLELTGNPGVEPAELELGPNAMQNDGNRLESCGYGPDGKLAVNGGRFLGYRRSGNTPQGPDDWMVISGQARQGDSGGPVFNEGGHVVGILWGTDGQEVVCVQAGRLHLLLDGGQLQIGVAQQRALVVGGGEAREFKRLSEQTGITQRNPTPAKPLMPGPEPYAPVVPVPPPLGCGPDGCGPNDCPQQAEQAGVSKQPVLPWRGDTQRRDDSQDARIGALIVAIERDRSTRDSRPPIVEQPKTQPEVKPAPDELSPLLAGLCVLGAIVAGFGVYFVSAKTN